MRLLAIESSTHASSCALLIDGVVTERPCAPDRNSSETLLPAIMALLAEHQLSLRNLDGIAFGAGPGAFTGLRVAAGVTQGLAFAADLPVAPIETLAAVAWANGAEYSLAMLDARMNEVYVGRYWRQNKRLQRQGELRVGAPTSFELPELAQNWTVCGNAVAAYPSLAGRLEGWRVAASALPCAGAVAELGGHVFADGGALAADFAQPVYVRDKVAFTTAERLARGGKA